MVQISHCAAGVRWLKHLHTVAHVIDRPTDTSTLQLNPKASCTEACAAAGAARSEEGVSCPNHLASQLDSCSMSAVHIDCTRPPCSAKHSAVENSSAATNSSAPSHLQCSNHQDIQDIGNGEAGCKLEDQVDQAAVGQEHSDSWKASAQQYATVQLWFHFLVRSHFKVRSCFIAYVQADSFNFYYLWHALSSLSLSRSCCGVSAVCLQLHVFVNPHFQA